MNEQLLIQGVLHEAFTRTSYAPEAEAADFLRRRFPYPNFCITAFSLSGTRLADSYRHQARRTRRARSSPRRRSGPLPRPWPPRRRCAAQRASPRS